jgi:hypothetical protein
MINNKEFNEWVKTVEHGLVGHNKYWGIGLMTIWLLDKGLFIAKDIKKNAYLISTIEIYDKEAVVENKSLYDCLVEAIEVIRNIHKEQQ